MCLHIVERFVNCFRKAAIKMTFILLILIKIRSRSKTKTDMLDMLQHEMHLTPITPANANTLLITYTVWNVLSNSPVLESIECIHALYTGWLKDMSLATSEEIAGLGLLGPIDLQRQL